MVIVAGGKHCTCGRDGCWEAYASATALIYQTQIKMLDDKTSSMWNIVDGDLRNVNGKTAFDAYRMGDKAGSEVVDKYISYIACGVANVDLKQISKSVIPLLIAALIVLLIITYIPGISTVFTG